MGEHIRNKGDQRAFFQQLFQDDMLETEYGYSGLRVGTFVTVKKEGFRDDQVFIITKIFEDGTFEIGTEKSVLTDTYFIARELSRVSRDKKTVDRFKKDQ